MPRDSHSCPGASEGVMGPAQAFSTKSRNSSSLVSWCWNEAFTKGICHRTAKKTEKQLFLCGICWHSLCFQDGSPFWLSSNKTGETTWVCVSIVHRFSLQQNKCIYHTNECIQMLYHWSLGGKETDWQEISHNIYQKQRYWLYYPILSDTIFHPVSGGTFSSARLCRWNSKAGTGARSWGARVKRPR